MNEMASFFQQRGTEIKLAKGEIVDFSKKGTVWFGGPMSLDAVESNGVCHFLSLLKGPLYFSLPFKGMSEESQSLWELSTSDLFSALGEKESLRIEFVLALQNWIEALSLPIFAPFPEGNAICIEAGSTMQLRPGQILACKKQNWIQVMEKELQLQGDPSLQLSANTPFFPLSSLLWFAADKGCKLRTLSSEDLVSQGLWVDALDHFHLFFQKRMEQKMKESERVQKRLLEDRKSEEEVNLNTALEQMASIFAEPTLLLHKPHSDLERVCQTLGKWLQVDFHFPPQEQTFNSIEAKLEKICQASRLRKRKVTLRANWWRENGGHFLGFVNDRPVAIINHPTLRYQLIEGSKKTTVDAHLAQQVARSAYSFYLPFPEEKQLSGKTLFSHFSKMNVYLKMVLGSLFCSVTAALVALFPPIATRMLFSFAVPQNNHLLVIYLTLGLVYAAYGYASFSFLRSYCLLKMEGWLLNHFQSSIWDRLLKLSPQFFRRFSAGNLFLRTSFPDEFISFLTGSTLSILFSGCFSLFYIFLMLHFDSFLAVATLCIALFSLGGVFFLARKKNQILKQALEMEGSLRSSLIQTIGGVGKLRVEGAENSAFSHCATAFTNYKTLQMRMQTIDTWAATLSAFLPPFSMGLIFALILGARPLSLPTFLGFNIALGSFIGSFYPLNTLLLQLSVMLPKWKRTEVILQEPLEEAKEKTDCGKLTGEIHFDSVVFGYEPAHPPILKQLSFKIKPHEFIGIVGPSGSGKSTLIRLLLGFEKPQSGGVYYDGKNLASLDPRSVRRQIGAVLQTATLFAGSLYDNLVSGSRYTPAQIERALALSGFDEDLKELPMGLMTYIPMNGETLSGGQRQRLLLAAALLSNPSILVFDEATSALDNQAQEKITRNIDTLNTTRIIVAQRLSTVRRADRIYVIQNGAIVQEGTFEELIAAAGLFSEMHARQSL